MVVELAYDDLLAVERRNEGATWFIDWSDFWVRDRAEREWLLEPILARGRGTAFYAAHKTGKSLLSLWFSGVLATGAEPITVVYLDYEMGDDDLYERLADMGYGPQHDLSRLKYALLPSLPPLDTQAGATALLGMLDDVQRDAPDHHLVLVIDTTSRAVAGDENSADTIRAFYRETGMGLRQRGITWARLDHAGKDGTRGQRGSSAKGDDVDVVWRIEQADNGLVLKRDAARMGWVPEVVPLHRHDVPLRFTVTAQEWPAGTKDTADTLERLGVPATTSWRKARAALTDANEHVSQAVLVAAVRYRKEAADDF